MEKGPSMKTPSKGSADGAAVAIDAPRASKSVADIWSVFEIKLLILLRSWYWYLLNALVFPGIMFYWSRALAPDDPDAIRRMMTDSIVFGVALMTSNSLASQMINDRFQNRLKLLIAMSMSKSSNAWGAILFAFLISAVTVALLLIFAAAASVDFQITWTFLLIVVPAVLSMAGLTLFIASYAPSAEVGQIMATLLGIALVMISPVFFPIAHISHMAEYPSE